MSETVKAVVKNHIDTAANLTSDNITPLLGEITIESDTLRIKIGDGITSWVNLPYKDSGLPQTFDISSSDTTINFRPLNGFGEIKYYDWYSGDGSNTFKGVPDGTEKIRFDDGSEVSELEGEGNGSMALQDVGTYWKVVSYEDYDHGSTFSWEKQKNGVLLQSAITSISLATSSNISEFPLPFPSVLPLVYMGGYDNAIPSANPGDGEAIASLYVRATSLTQWQVRCVPSGVDTDFLVSLFSSGRWRT